MLPWPTEPGLRQVGEPGPTSPVLLTCNYDFTVRQLMRALRGQDAWLVVAPAKGINVWCAAAGGHLTTHQVVTALKTSGIEDRVQHRRVILPQLAATGVIGLQVFRRCHWQVSFGPVRAGDLPRYLASGEEKTDTMRRVRFGPRERLEMAVVWAAPLALLVGGVSAWLRPGWCLPLVGGAIASSVTTFLVYDRIPGPRRALLSAMALALALCGTALAGGGGAALLAAATASLGFCALLTFDYAGNTPLEGGSHFEGQQWKVTLDGERCAGVFRCVEVCPEDCFEKPASGRVVSLAHEDRCIRCGACVVQCPKDALFFTAEDGRRIAPEVIRSFKLNLLGQRAVPAGAPDEGTPQSSGMRGSRDERPPP
jgi:ferredoxin